jgi:hypothetical protein
MIRKGFVSTRAKEENWGGCRNGGRGIIGNHVRAVRSRQREMGRMCLHERGRDARCVRRSTSGTLPNRFRSESRKSRTSRHRRRRRRRLRTPVHRLAPAHGVYRHRPSICSWVRGICSFCVLVLCGWSQESESRKKREVGVWVSGTRENAGKEMAHLEDDVRRQEVPSFLRGIKSKYIWLGRTDGVSENAAELEQISQPGSNLNRITFAPPENIPFFPLFPASVR